MFQRIGPAAMKKDLGNIVALLEYLGHPERKFESIHIAGTNGKGSTAHILTAALMGNGWKTGLYTSPHYRDFRERIKINGQLIQKKQVTDFVAKHQTFIESIQPSFFEITVAMAFQCFADAGVQIAVIETGLGGRLDSTNVLNPLVSVITNIGYDHQQFLGETLPEIAGEKAGIIKKGTPVIIGETQEEVRHVFRQKAIELGAPLIYADQIYRTEVLSYSLTGMQVNLYEREKCVLENMSTDLTGPYQAINLTTAFATLDALGNMYPDWRVPTDILPLVWKNIKKSTRLLGRWQLLSKNPLVLADSAHNKPGLELIFSRLKEIPFQNLHIVLGIVSDKDPHPVLSLFPKEATYYFAKADIPRGLEAVKLQEAARQHELKGRTYVSVKRALAAAKRNANPDDLIFVGGSIFTVAEVI
ncbi:MAG: bifunctional folylpolyglutamate synthase/dihydrofolate synthase [Saprospiraceae bacterium]|nr:bifunctional folylpolyglutamate synthase/dihydrofolate synthase [Saprospiraceae bacterium]